jgi:anti-sigma factor RsiW
MACSEFAECLSAYLDRQLAHDEQEATAAHLAACAACRGELAALTQLGDLLRGLPPERLGEDLSAAILAQVEPSPGPFRARWLASRPRVAVAAAGLGLVLVGASALLLWRAGLPRRAPAVLGPPPAAAEPYVREHAVYAAGQPLADRSSLLLATFGRGEGR